MINYISSIIIPMIIVIIISYGIIEKQKVFDLFITGATEGMEIVIKLFPTLLGIFLAIGLLRKSGILDMFLTILNPIITILKIPREIMPLALLRPISGSASLGIATDIMKEYGPDSLIGIIVSTIMGATETTIYTIAIYTSVVGVKRIRFVLIVSLIADCVGIMLAIILCRLMSNGLLY